MILGTDMAHHVRSVYELELAINKAKDEHTECILITPKKHVTTLGYMLHACDLSNPTKPFPVYNEWTGRVMQEFFAQSSDEKARGIDITLPEEKTAHIAAFQIGFLRFIRPFFEALNNIKDISMKEQLLHLNSNLQHWLEDRKKRGSDVSNGSGGSGGGRSTPSPTHAKKELQGNGGNGGNDDRNSAPHPPQPPPRHPMPPTQPPPCPTQRPASKSCKLDMAQPIKMLTSPI